MTEPITEDQIQIMIGIQAGMISCFLDTLSKEDRKIAIEQVLELWEEEE